MSHYQNTKKDFWNSLDSTVESIVCPCCGSHMSLQFSASYRLKLTSQASKYLNEQLSFYRRTIQTIEKFLQRHNSPAFECAVKSSSYIIDQELLAVDGSYITKGANFLRSYLKDLDIEHIDMIVTKFPLLIDEAVLDEKKRVTPHQLLQLIQPPYLSGGLITTTFDQPSIENLLTYEVKPAELLAKILNEDEYKDNDKLTAVYFKLKRLFPYITSYCKLVANKAPEGEDIDPLLRVLAILVAYFGDSDGEKDMENSIPKFSFGAYSQFRNWTSLERCLTSYFFVYSLQELFPKFAEFMHTINYDFSQVINDESGNDSKKFVLGSTNNMDNFSKLIQAVPEFEDVVLFIVDFACAGAPITIPEEAKIRIRQNNKGVDLTIREQIKNTIEAEVCGWVPKTESTESLLLIGGTAAGKTTLLQSTIVQVKRASANLGTHIDPCSPLSNLLLQYYEQRYDAGEWDGATENGCRTSIQLALRQADNPDIVTYLVINDIAGERFEEMLRIEKDYDEIQSPLAKANNIVFLFDLVAWRQLSALLKESPESSQEWESVKNERAKHAESGRAVADSHDLLIKLIERVKIATGKTNQLIDRTFILAIPKCDYYLDEGMFLNGWVKKLTSEGYMKKLGSEDNSPYMTTWKFPESLKESKDESIFNTALKGIDKMSELAAKAIKDLSKSQEKDDISSISAERVAKNIDSTLIYLEHTFKDVKIVPVSALGKMPKQDEDPTASFEAQAVPLFCEALLLLPMLKMCTNQTAKKEVDTVTEEVIATAAEATVSQATEVITAPAGGETAPQPMEAPVNTSNEPVITTVPVNGATNNDDRNVPPVGNN